MQKVYVVIKETGDYYATEEVMSVWTTQAEAEKECAILKEQEDWNTFHCKEHEVKDVH